MKTHLLSTSPQFYARAIGLLYLVVIAAGIISQMFISGQIIVNGDAATTANNILNHKNLYQLGFSIYLIEMASQIAQMAILYLLLKPASKTVSLLALSFALTGCTIKTISRLFYIAPLIILTNTRYLSVFSANQLQSLALLFLELNDQAAGLALAIFGFSTILNGYLIYKSTFLPRSLGILSFLGGLGWLTFLYPPLAHRIYPYILALGLIGGLAQIAWFLLFGVNEEQWKLRENSTIALV
jgi:hypothetical protein